MKSRRKFKPYLRIVLDDDGVFKVSSASAVGSITVEAILGVACGATAIDADVEVGPFASGSRRQVDALAMAVVSLREDDSVEWFVELNRHLHQVLFALHIQVDNLGHLGLRQRPWVVTAVTAATMIVVSMPLEREIQGSM